MTMREVLFGRSTVVAGLLAAAAALVPAAGTAWSQVRPDAPGSAPLVRLEEPRITPLPEAEWTDEQRALVERYAPEVRIGNGFRTMLRVPELVEAVMPFVLYTTLDSTLAPRHRALLVLRAAWLCQSEAIWAEHAVLARARRRHSGGAAPRRGGTGCAGVGSVRGNAAAPGGRALPQLVRAGRSRGMRWRGATTSTTWSTP